MPNQPTNVIQRWSTGDRTAIAAGFDGSRCCRCSRRPSHWSAACPNKNLVI